jgi:hypothetical protein
MESLPVDVPHCFADFIPLPQSCRKQYTAASCGETRQLLGSGVELIAVNTGARTTISTIIRRESHWQSRVLRNDRL